MSIITDSPVVVTIRDPDASNEYMHFGPGAVNVVDIDAGHMDLRDPEEYNEWAEGLLSAASQWEQSAHPAGKSVGTLIRDIVDSYDPDF